MTQPDYSRIQIGNGVYDSAPKNTYLIIPLPLVIFMGYDL